MASPELWTNDRPLVLLTYGPESSLALKEAAALGGCNSATALRWALRKGIARQPGGVGGQWRINRVGWAALLAVDDDALADLQAGRLTDRVRRFFRETRTPLPYSEEVAA